MTTVWSGGRPVTAKTIHTANVYLARVAVERYNAATDTFDPYTGTNAQVTFATDSLGVSPIAGLTNIAMTEVPGAVGTYQAQIASSALAALVPYAGQTVYQIVRVGPTLADANVVTPLVVRRPRYAQ